MRFGFSNMWSGHCLITMWGRVKNTISFYVLVQLRTYVYVLQLVQNYDLRLNIWMSN